MNSIVHHRRDHDDMLPTPFGASPSFDQGDHDQTAGTWLLTYFGIALRHRWLIAIICGAFLVLGLAVTIMSPREYSATTRIQIDRAATNVVDYGDVQRDGLNNWEFYETQYKLLESRSLAEKVVDELGLDQDNMFLADQDASAAEDISVLEVSAEDRRDWAVGMVRGSTRIQPIADSSMVDIGYVSRDPEMSARLANAVADAFIKQNLERRFEASAYARDFLKQRLDATRERLEESEREAAAYARSQGIVMTSGGTDSDRRQTLAADQLSRLNSELTAATAGRVQAESDWRNDRGGRAAASSLDNQTLNSLRRQRSEYRAELSKLESDFGPDYPRVKALTAQIAELDTQIERESAMVQRSVASDLEDRYRKALAAETALRRQVDAAKSRLLNEQQDGIKFNILEREVATNRALYEGLLQRYKEIGVAGGVGTNNVSIIDPALEPLVPSAPNMPINLALALMLGLVSSAAAIIVLEQIASSRIRPTEVQGKLGIPLLGSTPRVDENEHDEEASGELSEAYFSTLTSIQFSTEQGAPKTMLVTSAQKGEGKSTTANRIATDLAGLGQKVLLVDGDLRSPSVHKMFGKQLGTGVSDYLANRTDLAGVVIESGIENLALVTGGTIPPNPAKLLSGDRIESFFEEASKQYDHVVIDGPPVLGLADAPLLSRHAGGTLFVVEAQRTNAARARQAVNRLLNAQARLVGAIVTKFDARTGGYGYGYGYGSQYRYGD